MCKNSNNKVAYAKSIPNFKHKVVFKNIVETLISNFLIYFPSIPKKNNNQVDEYIKVTINSNEYLLH
jgi:hypothetical protein